MPKKHTNKLRPYMGIPVERQDNTEPRRRPAIESLWREHFDEMKRLEEADRREWEDRNA